MKRALWRLLWIVIIVYGIYYLNEQVKEASDLSEDTFNNEIVTLEEPSDYQNEMDDDEEAAVAEEDEEPVVQLEQHTAYDEHVLSMYEQDNSNVEQSYQQLEKQIRQAFLNREESFTVQFDGDSKKLKEDLGIIIEQAMTLDDYTAYVMESYRYSVQSFAGKNTITIDSKYRESIVQSAFVSKQAEEILAKIITPNMNDHEKVLAIHDWIVSNITYDTTLTHYTAYDALTLGTTVCQGYSLITHRLMNGAGIESIITEGEVDSGLHSWNMVKLDGEWFHIDTTWDDPVGGSGISYKYYLVTDDQLRKDHSWTNEYPAASASYDDKLQQLIQLNEQQGEQHRYELIREQIGLHWFDVEHTVSTIAAIEKRLKAAIHAGKKHLQFRYNGEQEMKQAIQDAAQKMNVSFSYRATFEPMNDGNSHLVNVHLEYE